MTCCCCCCCTCRTPSTQTTTPTTKAYTSAVLLNLKDWSLSLMAIALGFNFASPSIPQAASHCRGCQMEGISCSVSSMATNGLGIHSFEARRPDPTGIRNHLFDTMQTHWLPTQHDMCLSKVCAAADYSDSVPNSSNYINGRGYHPLEERKTSKRSKNTMLTPAETAKTIVEANNSALLVFPGKVHHEPHEDISWAEFNYIIDDQGDIFFRIFNGVNVLEDPEAINPVNVLIGMDIPMQGGLLRADKRKNMLEIDYITPYDYYFELLGLNVSDSPKDWRPSKKSHIVHPIYFAKCLTKAIDTEYRKMMDDPSNGLSIMGCLRPATMDEESYLSEVLESEDTGVYAELKEEIESLEDQEASSDSLLDYDMLSYDESSIRSTVYKLEIITIELFSVYGFQYSIDLKEFEDARADVLSHSAEQILEDLTEKGLKFNAALKALCRKKGLNVEGAHLVGVDSLGMDVRAFTGIESQTLRFPFKLRVDSASAAEKTIHQMLFPRYNRKKLKKPTSGRSDNDSC